MIILEDGTTPAGSNSYVDPAGAYFTTYLAGHLYGSGLSTATDANKEAAVRMATTVLDYSVTWHGYRNTAEQALEWPRTGVVVDTRLIAADTIPGAIQAATMELAIALLRRDRTDDSVAQPVKKISLGDGALDLDLGAASTDAPATILPDAVFQIVRKYGKRAGAKTGMTKTRRV